MCVYMYIRREFGSEAVFYMAHVLSANFTIRRAATVIIIAAAKGEAQQIIKGRGARASFMAQPLYVHYITLHYITVSIIPPDNVASDSRRYFSWCSSLWWQGSLPGQFFPDLLCAGEWYEDEEALKCVQQHEHIPHNCRKKNMNDISVIWSHASLEKEFSCDFQEFVQFFFFSLLLDLVSTDILTFGPLSYPITILLLFQDYLRVLKWCPHRAEY
jgi:hypothetical protein